MLFHRRRLLNMKKFAFLALTVAALAFPTLASAHDFHRSWGWHGPHGHAHFVAPFPHAHFVAPFPVPVPFGFVHPAYVAPPAYAYPAPVYGYPAPYPPAYAAPAPAYYGPPAYAAPAPVFSIRTPHVALSIPLPPF
jgi:hypothetical protein